MQPVSQLVFASPEGMGPPGSQFVVPSQGDRASTVQTPDPGDAAPLKRTKKINQFFGQSTSNNNAQTPYVYELFCLIDSFIKAFESN